jgi:hypothetical protein
MDKQYKLKQKGKSNMETFFTIHELKTDPESYDDIERGTQNNTVRIDDRGFKVDDYLVLRRTVHTGDEMKISSYSKAYRDPKDMGKDTPLPKPLEYTGVALMCKVTHICKHKGLQPGWAVLSFIIIDVFPSGEGGQIFNVEGL